MCSLCLSLCSCGLDFVAAGSLFVRLCALAGSLVVSVFLLARVFRRVPAGSLVRLCVPAGSLISSLFSTCNDKQQQVLTTNAEL